MPGTLYVVSTPIGNLDDITLRALAVLKSVALVAAEDTRRTGNLLRHFGIATPTTSLHEHNEHQKLPQLIDRLLADADIAVVSDAGTPVVADPGQRLVAAAVRAGIRVVPVPGASAVLAALAVSGFPADEFVFAGFAPHGANDRKKWLLSLAAEPRPVVFFEAPHRIRQTLAVVGEIFGERPTVVARELTKIHEEVSHTTASAAHSLAISDRGEFCIVLGPSTNNSGATSLPRPEDVAAYFGQMTELGVGGRRQAAAETARKFGLTTNEVYALLERLKDGPSA